MVKERSLYTCILAHYDQYGYIFTAIDSILAQDYPAIEIIVVDDGSEIFGRDETLAYIEKNKKQNIKSYQVLVNEENIGTVRSLNRALRAATGEYVQLFAADDRLHDEKTASNFVNEFEKLGEDAVMLCAHALVMDDDLNPTGKHFLSPALHERYSGMNAQEQFKTLAFACDWGMGAVCARTSLYQQMGYFDERYRYIEDWPFFLRMTRNGIKAHIVSFIALDHRGGGISKTDWFSDTSDIIKEFIDDLLRVMEVEILPFLREFSTWYQEQLIHKYYEVYRSLLKIGGDRKCLLSYDFWRFDKKQSIKRSLAKWRIRNRMFVKQSLKVIYLAALFFLAALFSQSILPAGGPPGIPGAQVVPAMIDFGVKLSGGVLVCALVFLVLCIGFWAAYKAYRRLRTR